MAMPSTDAVLDALRVVQDPDLRRDIVSLGFVKDLTIDEGTGAVAFAIELTTPACPVKDQLRDQARAAVAALPDVREVRIEMTSSVRSTTSTPQAGRQAIAGVKNVIAVGAGKGGVGKTTVAVNLALALAKKGSRVGLLDADIYGPNVPIMLGVRASLETDGQKILPVEKFGVQCVSMGFLTGDADAVIWRGPMLHGVLRQFLHDVRWNDLDYLVIDLPPGTGDVALSLSQHVAVTGAVVVTTPQVVSVADTRRAVQMYQKLTVPVLGLVENMSYFACGGCGRESDLFGRGGGARLAEDLRIPFLGAVPIAEPVRAGGDAGLPIVMTTPEAPAAQALVSVAEQVAAQVSISSFKTIPLTPVS